MSEFWQGKEVLVTGGAGFIGSHLVERLLAEGASVRVLAKYNSSGSIGFLEPARERYGDQLSIQLGTISDSSFVRSAVGGVDTVFHLAALIGIPYSYVAPGHYVEVNINGTLAVLEAVREGGVRRMVHTSTSECFGSAQYVPMDEKHPIVGQSPYSATKIGADQLADSYWRSFETPVVTLRPFNTFGPRQSMRAVIPTIIRQLLLGPTVRLGSVTPIRDMNPVANTVDGFVRAAQTPDVEGELFVVGSGSGRTIGDIVEEVGQILGVVPEVSTQNERVRPRNSEVDRLICDYSKAEAMLGYVPSESFSDCLASTIDYCRQTSAESLSYAI